MGKNIINFIIETSISGVDKAGELFGGLKAKISGVAIATKQAEGWFGKLKVAIRGVFGAFGILMQIASGVVALWQVFKERADQAAEAAREALEKQKERLNNMAEALKNWTNSLKETADLQERLEKERLITAEYEARTKAVKEAANAQALGDSMGRQGIGERRYGVSNARG